MLTCSNCGASVREGARFCTTCGTRLNDPVTTDTTSAWATPVTSDPTATATESAPDTVVTETASERAQVAPGPDAAGDEVNAAVAQTGPTGDPDVATAEPLANVATTDDAFNWSWGPSSTAQGTKADQGADQVEVESGVVSDAGDSSDAGPDSGEVVDATEIDILEVDERDPEGDGAPGGTAPEPDPDSVPETSDALLVVDEDEEERQEESETLAAWAEQWQTPDSDDAGADETPGIPPAPTATAELEQTAVVADGEVQGEAEEEDTVARAERLIGELRAIIPTLARPMTAAPTITTDNAAIADELEEASRTGQFDDLRDVLQAARANPRDVDTMLSLSGRVDRLLELLDDRDNLARVSTGAATRLRPNPVEPEQ